MNKKLIMLLPILLLVGAVKAQTTEIFIQTTAQCSECKEHIEKALLAVKGVKFAELDVKTKKAHVIYNAGRTNPDLIRQAIASVGYDADSIPADPEAVRKLSPCCTKDGHKE